MNVRRTLLGGALAALAAPLAAGCGAGPDAGLGEVAYSIAVLPDTQYYASSWPDIFTAQTRWLAENHAAQQIAFVLHTGDIVDSDVPAQWNAAVTSLGMLDGQVPYVLTAGNHDYADIADRMGMINAYFPPSRFAATPSFGGTFEPGHLENNFNLFEAGGGRWLVLALEFGPRDEVLAWAAGVLAAHADAAAVVITHAYLYRDGTRYDHVGAPAQQYNPHAYVMMGQAASTINDGEEMWRKLIAPAPNVKLVLCGHDVNTGGDLPPGTTARLTSVRADGTRVHQILANYQSCTGPPCEADALGTVVHGGNGYLRLLRVSPAEHTIGVSTYSPFTDAYLSDPSNQFTLDLD